MSRAMLFHLALAIASGLMAVLLWHQAMPRLLDARGRWHSLCVWLLGMVLAVTVPSLIARALADAPVQWQLSLRDLLLVLYATCRWHRARQLSAASWSRPHRLT